MFLLHCQVNTSCAHKYKDTPTWSGKNSMRKGPRRMMPKLSGSSLLFTRLTLWRQRERRKGCRQKDRRDIKSEERKKVGGNFKQPSSKWKKTWAESRTGNAIHKFVTFLAWNLILLQHFWQISGCFGASPTNNTVRLNIPPSRHSDGLDQCCHYFTVIKQAWWDCPFKAADERRGKAASCCVF